MRSTYLLLFSGAVVAAYVDESSKAVIIEDTNPLESARAARQLIETDNLLNDLGLSPLLTPPLQQPCLNKEGNVGRCKSLNECYPYFKIFNLSWRDTWVMGHYDTCSYRSPEGSQVFGVCCDSTPRSVTEENEDDNDETKFIDENNDAIVGEFPIEFALAGNCGFRTPQPSVTLYDKTGAQFYIVNGAEAVPHEYPFMAALMNRNRQFCGGSLIDANHILTAAHCVAHLSKNDVQHLRVRLGDHNIKSNSAAGRVEKRVKRVIRHIGFSSSTLHNDVAILTLEEDVEYTPTIQPICLAAGTNSFVNQRVSVAGWGTLSEGGTQPASLNKVEVEVWSNERCKNSYGSSAPGGITKEMLCASLPEQDSCSGDSGGPLFSCPYGGQCTQIGIVSWGIGCAKAQYPGVYTRVTEMRDWISRIVTDY
ncbi:trypsin-1 isoform X3 [Eurytemora carolleeae]|uniref:trypsin-1 isoform X3 n=1 Tax=Eurytemora carolleeae TaxID=1294199 RepID=UPI000C789286|nr:trypsin-1 isoform X3 [Eurytemora carolleeae]|eukprot:XP_023347415.1 trypsin-1-like isoform X3 [Eurytemora affinis]